MRELSREQARRIALAAQGFCDPRLSGRADIRHLRRVIERIKLLQIDSVNVLTRSHYLPLFSRLGPYAADLLDDAAYRRRELFEYWAHVASFIPMRLHPLLRQRMQTWEPGSRVRVLCEEEPGYIDDVLAQVTERGPLSAADLDEPGERAGPWWGWSKGKIALEWLFTRGQISVADRRNFTRYYDLTERVVPASVLAAPTPDLEDTYRQLLLLSADALGVGTAADLIDYFRLRPQLARPRLAELVATGQLQQATVSGWFGPAYLYPQARLPRKVDAAALLSPFDSVVWDRERTERLFDFYYRIEIYVPKRKRIFGYYVLPFLLGDQLVARVDVKAERASGVLDVRGAFAEDGQRDRAGQVAGPLADELRSLAAWLGLERVAVHPRGDLAQPLANATRA